MGAVIPQHSSATNEHPTPPDIVERARRLMGHFDLDPASCQEFNKSISAARIYTQADDGLAQDWEGRVFLNPPGGRLRFIGGRWVQVSGGKAESSMRVWWQKLADEYLADNVTEAFFVGFTLEILRTSQQGTPVQRFYRCYPRDRLAFKGSDPTHANVLVWMPPMGANSVIALGAFREVFGDVGFCEGPAR